MTGCPWCAEDLTDDVDPNTLCRSHLAEYEGLPECHLDRMEAEQAAEYADVFDQ
ncbi:hypothetical protein [Actinoplanes sp. NPDC026623]|uniref:hypothetical protein n=1 Tax=Actinoplanes sp. NPDC026623 TaxID=3155610 RepID=UPI0033DA0BFF